MAINDMKVISGAGPKREFVAEDRTTSSITVAMQIGEPVKLQSEGATYVIPLLTGDPEAGTDEFVGIVSTMSTESSSVDGVVQVTTCKPVVTVLQAQATDTTAINTAAKLKAIVNGWISLDVTGAGTNGPTGVFTFDENEASDEDVHGFRVMSGDIVKGYLRCIVHTSTSLAGPST